MSRRSILLIACALAACSEEKTPDPEPDPNIAEVTLFPTTRVLDQAAFSGMIREDPNQTLVFAALPPALEGVSQGAILLAGQTDQTPEGLVRMVVSVEEQNGETRIRTVNAPIQLAFQKLHVHFEATSPRETPGALTIGISPSLPIHKVIFDGDKDESTENDQVVIDGVIGGGFDISLTIDTDWGAIVELPASLVSCLAQIAQAILTGSESCNIYDLIPDVVTKMHVGLSADGSIDVAGVAYVPYNLPVELPKIPLGVYPLGPVIVVAPSFQVVGGLSAGASSRFETGVEAHGTFGVGFEAHTSPLPLVVPTLDEPTTTFATKGVDVTLQASAKLSLGPRIELRINQVVGLYGGIDVFAEVLADHERDPCFELRAGIEANYGLKLGFDLQGFGELNIADFNDKQKIIDEVVETGSCKLPDSGSTIPPGAGPDEATLLNPTFTPWSMLYSGTVETHPHSVYEGEAWSAIAQTADGNFVVHGSHASTLLKVKENGALVWANRYDHAADWPNTLRSELHLDRVVPADDGTMFVTGDPYALLRIAQDGSLVSAVRFEVDGREGQHRFLQLVRDGAGGVLLAGAKQQVDDTIGWILRVGADGKLIWSSAFDEPGFDVYPTIALAYPDGFLIGGSMQEKAQLTNSDIFLMRLDMNGALVWSKKLDACAGADRVQATQAIKTFDDRVVITGNLGSSPYRSFFAKLRSDGTVLSSLGFWSGGDLEWLTVRSITELPTTGFMVAGEHYVGPPNWYDLFVAQLDVSGQPVWARRYGFVGEQTISADDRAPGVRLTDDGGLMFSGYVDRSSGADHLWLTKVPAKNGLIDFAPSSAISAGAINAVNFDCALIERNWTPTLHAEAATPVPLVLAGSSVATTPVALTP